MKRRAGFTLLELMIVTTVAGLVTAAAGALYLEARLASARIEAELQLQREASLIAEVLGRDLRSAPPGAPASGELALETPDGPVRYRVEGGLVRWAGGERWVLGRHVTGLERAGSEVALTLERPLLGARTVKLTRAIHGGSRR